MQVTGVTEYPKPHTPDPPSEVADLTTARVQQCSIQGGFINAYAQAA
jgi:hypothetical protein